MSYKGKGRWVKNKYLSDKKPKASVQRRERRHLGRPVPAGIQGRVRSHPGRHPRPPRDLPRYPQVTSFGGRRSSSGVPRQRSGRRLHDLELDGRLAAGEVGPGERQAAGRQRGHLLAEDLDGAARIRGLALDVGSRFADRQSLDHVHVSVYGNSGTAE